MPCPNVGAVIDSERHLLLLDKLHAATQRLPHSWCWAVSPTWRIRRSRGHRRCCHRWLSADGRDSDEKCGERVQSLPTGTSTRSGSRPGNFGTWPRHRRGQAGVADGTGRRATSERTRGTPRRGRRRVVATSQGQRRILAGRVHGWWAGRGSACAAAGPGGLGLGLGEEASPSRWLADLILATWLIVVPTGPPLAAENRSGQFAKGPRGAAGGVRLQRNPGSPLGRRPPAQ